MHRATNCRTQVMIISLDDVIKPDNPVRLLDEVIDDIIESGKIDIPTGKCFLGRRAYSAIDLVKLYLYGYLNRVTTCRGLAEAARINLEIKWLIKDQTPSYRTIADFRKNHGDFIRQVETGFRAALREDGLISNNTWVIDGSKVKASAARDMKSLTNLKKQLVNLDQSIEEYLGKDAADEHIDKRTDGDDSDPDNAQSNTGCESKPSKLDRLIKKRAKVQKLIEFAKEKGVTYISGTDLDAMLVKSRRGKVAGYNVQIVVDSEHHMIAGYQLVDTAADNSSLYEVIAGVSHSTSTKPETILADKGYTNFLDIQKLQEELKSNVVVSLQKSTATNNGLVFTCDPTNNQVICPAGKIMKASGRQYTRNQYYYSYKCKDCGSCKIKQQCTKSKSCRTYRLSENQVFKEQYRAFMETEAAKELAGKRKTIVEHVFGTIANMMNYNGFILRGKHKVLNELTLYSLAYNFKRFLNVTNPAPLKGRSRKSPKARLIIVFLSPKPLMGPLLCLSYARLDALKAKLMAFTRPRTILELQLVV